MPNIPFESLDAVPEELREFVEPIAGDDNKVVVNVVPKKRLDEFRDNNTALLTERDTLKAQNAKYLGIVGEDAEAFATDLIDLKMVNQRVSDGELTESTDIEELVAKRVSGISETYDEQLRKTIGEVNAWKEKTNQKDAELKRNYIDQEITSAVLNEKSGAKAGALHDIKERAYRVFKVEDGKVIAKNGETTIYSSNGVDPMSTFEWLSTTLRNEAGHLFKDSSGGGASSGNKQLESGLTQAQIDAMSPLDKIKYGNENPS